MQLATHYVFKSASVTPGTTLNVFPGVVDRNKHLYAWMAKTKTIRCKFWDSLLAKAPNTPGLVEATINIISASQLIICSCTHLSVDGGITDLMSRQSNQHCTSGSLQPHLSATAVNIKRIFCDSSFVRTCKAPAFVRDEDNLLTRFANHRLLEHESTNFAYVVKHLANSWSKSVTYYFGWIHHNFTWLE